MPRSVKSNHFEHYFLQSMCATFNPVILKFTGHEGLRLLCTTTDVRFTRVRTSYIHSASLRTMHTVFLSD